MKTKSFVAKWLVMVMVLVVSITTLANIGIASSSDINVENEISVQPRSMYFYQGTINTPAIGDIQKVDVETRAFVKVDKVYHSITVYKNGQLVHNETYISYNSVYRRENLSFNAQTLDKFDIYVTHYTEHNGIVESSSSERHLTFR